MTTIILIRHGESAANRDEIFAGHLNVELEEKGMLQAEKTAEYIVCNYKVDKVYSSDLTRAYKTGKAVSDRIGLEVETRSDLREIDAGVWDGIKFDDLPTLFPEGYKLWISDIGRGYCDGGETVCELSKRIIGALEDIAKANDGKTVVVATHATPIRVAQTMFQFGNLEKMYSVPWVSNASVTVVEYNDGEWKCVKISEDAHLGELKTELPKNV